MFTARSEPGRFLTMHNTRGRKGRCPTLSGMVLSTFWTLHLIDSRSNALTDSDVLRSSQARI